MLGKNSIRKVTTSLTLAAVWCVYSMVAMAMPTGSAAEITVSGQVTVNGQTAVSGATVTSGSTISTGADSSAVITLGKSGRIELFGNTSISLTFSDGSIVGTLTEGKARISDAIGVATTIATKTATLIADSAQANNFLVEIECSHIHVDTASGSVTMREGVNDKQVAAGTSATAGNLEQTGCKPCLRPGSAPQVAIAGWPWLAAIAAGVVGAAIFFAGQQNNTVVTGTGQVISPTR